MTLVSLVEVLALFRTEEPEPELGWPEVGMKALPMEHLWKVLPWAAVVLISSRMALGWTTWAVAPPCREFELVFAVHPTEEICSELLMLPKKICEFVVVEESIATSIDEVHVRRASVLT